MKKPLSRSSEEYLKFYVFCAKLFVKFIHIFLGYRRSTATQSLYQIFDLNALLHNYLFHDALTRVPKRIKAAADNRDKMMFVPRLIV